MNQFTVDMILSTPIMGKQKSDRHDYSYQYEGSQFLVQMSCYVILISWSDYNRHIQRGC
jgi:hypothetical protein